MSSLLLADDAKSSPTDDEDEDADDGATATASDDDDDDAAADADDDDDDDVAGAVRAAMWFTMRCLARVRNTLMCTSLLSAGRDDSTVVASTMVESGDDSTPHVDDAYTSVNSRDRRSGSTCSMPSRCSIVKL